jgi:hypothetical protein
MPQSRLLSFLEANVSTLIGFVVSMLLMEYVVGPLYHLPTTTVDNFSITCIFTVVSIARGYFVRRFFNRSFHGQR